MSEEMNTLGGLVGFGDKAGAAIRAAVEALSAAWPLGGGDGLRSGAVGQALDVIETAVAVPVCAVFGEAWRQYADVRVYCDPEQFPPGQTETIPLVRHTVEWGCDPVLEVVVGGRAGPAAKVAEINFAVQVEIIIQGGRLAIRDGKFIHLEGGAAEYCLRVRVEETDFGPWEGTLELPAVLHFGEGMRICPDRAIKVPIAAPEEPAAPAPAPATIQVPAVAPAPPADAAPAPAAAEGVPV